MEDKAIKNNKLVISLSAVIWGFGCFIHKQFVRGILFLLAEVFVVSFLIRSGINNLKLLVTLGELEQQKVWDEAKSVYIYTDGDRSLIILLYGIITIAVIGIGYIFLRKSVKNACENIALSRS